MNSIVNTQPPAEEEGNPIDRPNGTLKLNDLGEIIGLQPRPLLLIGREPAPLLPSRRPLLLFDALLARSWDRLEDATPDFEFGANALFLRVQIGEGKRTSNDRLKTAFNELLSTKWRFPVALVSEEYVEATILSSWRKEGRLFIWQFTEPVIALCQHVPLWVRYPMTTARKLKKASEHRLHEMLLVFARRRHPIWNLPLLELRVLMGHTALGPDDEFVISDERFIRDVIEPAAGKIEQATGWKIKIERLPDPRIAPTLRIRFTIRKPGSKPLVEA